METLSRKELKPFRIGDWLVLPEINRISGPTGKLNVGARTMQVLVYLAKQQGRVVTKEDLLSTVWDDVIVTEDSLIKSISVLRQIFHRETGNNPKIDTVRAIGYMLLSPVKYMDKKPLTERFNSKASKIVTYSTLVLSIAVIFIGLLFSSAFKEKRDPKGITNVTNNWTQERVPRFSPNGNKVLFASGNEGWNNLDIHIKNLKNNEVSNVVDDEFLKTDPIWSPDATTIAFFRNQGKKVSLISKNLITHIETKLIDINGIVNLSAMVWSPDGNWIIYADYPDDEWKSSLYKVNINTNAKIRLTYPKKRIIGDLSPRFSPDGKKLAFIRANKSSMMYSHIIPGHGTIYIREEINGEEISVLDLKTDLSGIAWLDNDHLVYAVGHNNYSFRIYQFNILTKEKSLLLETDEIIRNIDYHVPTNKLVFETWNERYSIWSYSANDKGTNFSRRYLKNTTNNWQPIFHSKTNTTAYISTRSGAAELWINRNGQNTQLTHFKNSVVRNASWSPDGNKLVFEVNIDGQDDIYQVDIDTQEMIPVLTSDIEEKYPSWSKDGRHIYFASNKSGKFEIWKKDINSDSEDRQITTNGGLRSLEYNGDLLYSKPRDRGIWKIHNQKEEKLISEFRPRDAGNWNISQDKLFYIKRDRFWKPEMYQYDLLTGQNEHYQSFSMSVSTSYPGLTINSNSNNILITHNDRVRSDIKMITPKSHSSISHLISFVSIF